eukprot:6359736-Pyramimonas_sp.AAC.1
MFRGFHGLRRLPRNFPLLSSGLLALLEGGVVGGLSLSLGMLSLHGAGGTWHNLWVVPMPC